MDSPSAGKGEAAGQLNRLSEALDFARTFWVGLSQDTSLALREPADIASTPPKGDRPSWLDQIRGLSREESGETAAIALHCLEHKAKSVRDFGLKLLQSLACFRFEPLGSEVCRSLREKAIYWPASLYHDTGDAETHALLELLEDANDSLDVHHLLQCVAWTRSDAAVACFRDWTRNPPRWTSLVNAQPANYPLAAGWSLNAKGERFDLISLTCHLLFPAVEKTLGAIACRARADRKCPQCELPAAVLFDFTPIQADLPKNAPVKVNCCLYCSMYSPNFVRYSDDGAWEWVESGATPPEMQDVSFESRFVTIGSAKCPPFACANIFELDDASSVGGAPMWMQDEEYPHCPTCAERMTFLAQHDNSAIQEEGLHYAFFCPTCRISAVHYQQT